MELVGVCCVLHVWQCPALRWEGCCMHPCLPPSCRSAPSSPTHHPLMASEFNLREMEAKFALPHTPPSSAHFTLPPLFASSSLPASPSRNPSGFAAATPFKYFPLGVRSNSVEALAPEVARKRELSQQQDDTAQLPAAKRSRPAVEEEDRGEEGKKDGSPALKTVRPIPMPAIATLPGASSFGQPSSMQFFQIPVLNQPPGAPVLRQPLSTFLPHSFISTGSAVSSHPSGPGNGSTNSKEEG